VQYLTLGDLKLYLEVTYQKNFSLLTSCLAGQIYGPLISEKYERLKSIPAILVRERPLTEELSDADIRHDNSAAQIYNAAQAAIEDAFAEEAIKEAAGRIKRDIVPSLSIIKASYATEAANAKARRDKLAEREKDLRLFPLPGGKTLYEAAVQFFTAGDDLGGLLNDRALSAALGESERSGVVTLRGEIIGLLGRFRQALTDELESNPKLPRDLPVKLFAYAEQLNESRYTQYLSAQKTKKSQEKADEKPQDE
jgi:hypothetical protein